MVWKMTTLGSVCKIDKANYHGEGLPYVGMENIVSGSSKLVNISDDLVKSATFQFNQKHVLYGRLRPYLNKVALPNFEGHCSSEIFPLLCSDHLLREYLYYWLSSESTVDNINATCTGARMPRANVKEILTFQIPLPPLPEQCRIVAHLDAAFGELARARVLVEENLAGVEALWESRLGEVFGGKHLQSSIKSVGTLSFVKSGGTPSRAKAEYWVGGDIPWYSSGELNDVFTTEPKETISTQGLQNSNARLFPTGSLLIGIYDTAALKMSIADRPATFNQAIVGVEPDDKIEMRFLMLAIESQKKELLKLRRGVRQKNLSLAKIKAIMVPVPEMSVQKDILNILDEYFKNTTALRHHYHTQLLALDELKQSLLGRAFAGEL